jgi:hypothetical protein
MYKKHFLVHLKIHKSNGCINNSSYLKMNVFYVILWSHCANYDIKSNLIFQAVTMICLY